MFAFARMGHGAFSWSVVLVGGLSEAGRICELGGVGRMDNGGGVVAATKYSRRKLLILVHSLSGTGARFQ